MSKVKPLTKKPDGAKSFVTDTNKENDYNKNSNSSLVSNKKLIFKLDDSEILEKQSGMHSEIIEQKE